MAFHLLPSSHPRVLQHSRVRSSINVLLFLQTATGLITRVRVQYGLSLSVFTSSPFFLYHTTCKSIIQKVPHFFFECSGSADFLFFFTQPCFLSFQLSLTLLVLYRCSCIFSLRGLVPLSSILVLMIYSLFLLCRFTAITPPYSGALVLLRESFTLSVLFCSPMLRFWLFVPRSPLLHKSLLISFPSVT